MFELFDFDVIVTRSACLARPASRSRECCRRAAVLKMKPDVTYFSTSHIKVVLRIDVWGYQAPVVVAKFLTFSMSDDFLTMVRAPWRLASHLTVTYSTSSHT